MIERIYRKIKAVLKTTFSQGQQTQNGLETVPFSENKDHAAESRRKFAPIKALFQITKVVDIGSNDGQFAFHSSISFPNVFHYCFEPLQVPFDILTSKFRNNRNFTLYNYALGSVQGKVQIFQNEYTPSSSILEMDELHKTSFEFTRHSTPKEIEIRMLDSLIRQIAPNQKTMIKIDVQGFGMEVIKGGSQFIRECGVVIIEMSFTRLYKNQPLFHDIYTVLYNLGFRYHGNIEQLLSPVNKQILQADCLFYNKELY